MLSELPGLPLRGRERPRLAEVKARRPGSGESFRPGFLLAGGGKGPAGVTTRRGSPVTGACAEETRSPTGAGPGSGQGQPHPSPPWPGPGLPPGARPGHTPSFTKETAVTARRDSDPVTVRPRPCPSCPYRRDVPSGIWEAEEYSKLPGYDLDIPDQLAARAVNLFHCHSQPVNLCAGWAGCHDMTNMLAVRLHARDVDPAVFEYVSPVPLFGSGAEAAAHGMRDLAAPGAEARRKIAQLLRARDARLPADSGDSWR